ncbi:MULTISPECIES: hypothetical protein [Planktothricoides]|uniref:Uncharacterized protein n=1 Tax=Planktothricoides raciborskii FACHB-1370 TaxID=2949576 RepID=A0ABR8EEJ3_9CYAN|nr:MULTISPECIES: hypothetical protein [Planktothricoides]MBD2544588.1 hypothetical protein [Planktothricoides raciborskii FACHB-1370]MBD2583533.1 hypothetical protein [Planktothricoides raciborskii FACHB-1261]
MVESNELTYFCTISIARELRLSLNLEDPGTEGRFSFPGAIGGFQFQVN